MEAAIQTVVKVFLKSAKGKDSMGGSDFDNLVKKQLGNVLSDTDSKGALKEMRKGLDDNQDGKVSFEEYMKLIGYLATSMSAAHTKSKEDPAQSAAAAGANCAPAAESETGPERSKPAEEEKKKEEAAQPEPAAAAVAAAPAAAAAAVVEEKPEEKVEEAPAAAEGEVKSDDASS
ncbi:unnamed protein product [Merluccius merluccius]